MGALFGVAIGDAMGMPSQTMSRAEIRAAYGEIVDFTAAADTQPVSTGLKAATITDDTEQTILLAEMIAGSPGAFDETAWANALLDWERGTHARGINDLLGPSTKRALDELMRGIPATETGRNGTTNGAAMRISPVGIATPPEPLSVLVDRVAETCRITHNTSTAIAAAAAVAAVVSAGIDGAAFEEAIGLALASAREGARRGYQSSACDVAERIEAALKLACREPAATVAKRIGTSVASLESVPMAFATVRLAAGDTWSAAKIAANIGDDTDTIGAIASGMAGACSGVSSLPADKVAIVAEVNSLDFAPLAHRLLAIRGERRQIAELRERAV
jgi:ADP-ribosylglycohydrolase